MSLDFLNEMLHNIPLVMIVYLQLNMTRKWIVYKMVMFCSFIPSWNNHFRFSFFRLNKDSTFETWFANNKFLIFARSQFIRSKGEVSVPPIRHQWVKISSELKAN